MSKKFFITFVLVAMLSQNSWSQRRMKQMDSDKQAQEDKMKNDEKEPWYEKLSYGGNVGASFSTGFSSVLLQPLVFYRAAPKTTLGAGFTYIYWSQKYTNSLGRTDTYEDNVYGLNLFARQVLFDPVFIHAEYNPMNFTSYDYLTRKEVRVWHNAFYVGGGMQQKFSNRSGYYIMLLYDVLWESNKSFYPTPYDIRMGFFF